MAKTKKKGHPGFALKCRKVWTFKKWESCVKKNKGGEYNPYAICNNKCKKEARKKKKR